MFLYHCTSHALKSLANYKLISITTLVDLAVNMCPSLRGQKESMHPDTEEVSSIYCCRRVLYMGVR